MYKLVSIASDDGQSLMKGLEEEVLAYQGILVDEVRNHKQFSRITMLTGFGLLVLGVALLLYYPPLGWLLLIFGVLRVLNSVYDFQREDELRRRLRLLEERFGRHRNPSRNNESQDAVLVIS